MVSWWSSSQMLESKIYKFHFLFFYTIPTRFDSLFGFVLFGRFVSIIDRCSHVLHTKSKKPLIFWLYHLKKCHVNEICSTQQLSSSYIIFNRSAELFSFFVIFFSAVMHRPLTYPKTLLPFHIPGGRSSFLATSVPAVCIWFSTAFHSSISRRCVPGPFLVLSHSSI